MNYSSLGIEYQMAVKHLIEPLNPDLITAFLIYKDAVQGRKPFLSEPYLYGLFDGLVHHFEQEPTVLLPRYQDESEERSDYLEGIAKSDLLYSSFVTRSFEMRHPFEKFYEVPTCPA